MTQQQKKVMLNHKKSLEDMARIFNTDFNRWFDLQLKSSINNALSAVGFL